jgi:hypothetical protein
MPTDSEQEAGGNTGSAESAVEQFLRAVEGKTNDPAHHRLLKACRQANPSTALEAELRAILTEISNET